MVGIIVYGIIIGVILLMIKPTQTFGALILAIEGILFVGTILFMLLGNILKMLLPIIIVVGVIGFIYNLATRKKEN